MPAPLKRIAVPIAAASALAAAAFFMHPAAGHPAVLRMVSPQAAQTDPDVQPRGLSLAIARAHLASRPAVYTVQAGDTLSSIAGRVYSQPSAWPVIYWANHIRWADVIKAGQVLKVPAEPAVIPAAPVHLGPPAPRPVTVLAAYAPAPARTPAQAPAVSYQGSYPGGAFGACVVARESGGNAQVVNASGHWGLYQFSASTWQEYGGSAADFGHVGAAGQEQVFANALARGGQSNWSAYDAC